MYNRPPAAMRPSNTGIASSFCSASGVPLDHWFRNELREFTREILLDRQTLDRGYFRPEAVQLLLDDHQSGRFDHSLRLWALLVLELWQRQWL